MLFCYEYELLVKTVNCEFCIVRVLSISLFSEEKFT